MRLGAGLLSALLAGVAAAQEASAPRDRRLPWEAPQVLPPWQALEEGSAETPPVLTAPDPAPLLDLRASLARDGSLRILDRRGVVRLKLGLPGRVTGLWKDGGVGVEARATELALTSRTPLSRGVAELPWGEADFRPGLLGLLWILDDGERTLVLLHPATGRVEYLPLPLLNEPELAFWPDHLELRERATDGEARQSRKRWSLPWQALLPQLLRLAQPAREGRHGTAFQPFPKD